MESPESVGVVLDIPAYSSSPAEIPRRIRRRLLECKSKSPSITSIQDIEAKLNEANLRRQQFHEWLSNKARRKPKSPSWSSSQDEHLGQRLEAKLHAAQQKRLTIIAKAQMRLAKLDELRQAAKSEVEMRFESRREELGTKVESRVQKAEINRMLLLKARKQRKAAVKERTARSLLQRMTQERKYKDCVRTAIYQKRAAAERKRIGLLEAEKTRVHAKVMRVRRVAKSVYQQREVERRRMMDQLEDRLQKAKKQRAEYLRQRGHIHTVRVRMHRQGDVLSRKLARCWRQFLRSRKTTFVLAKDYNALEISEEVVKSMQFEQLARRIESAGTLQTVKAVLDRFEKRLIVSRTAFPSQGQTSLDSIDHLLKRLASPKRKSTPSGVTRSKGTSTPSGLARSRGTRKVGSSRGFQDSAKLSRYPVRVVLCAYMIVGHPAAVFNGQGEHETMLAESATNLIRELELLIKIILDGPTQNAHLDSDPAVSTRKTFRTQLECFDAAWCSYLYRFVAWKVKDAKSLEDDLVRAACQMELSMMQTCKLSVAGESTLTHDMEAVQKQVKEDQKLLREKVLHLSGDAGVERMEYALSDTRSKYFEARELGSPIVSPILQISSPKFPSSSARPSPTSTLAERSISDAGGKTPNRVVRSLFNDDASTKKSSVPSSARVVAGPSAGDMSVDNEVLVNEIIHEQHHSFADSLDVSNEDQKDIIKEKVKETVEKAFWDGIAESLDGDEPAYGRVIELVKEVRDELSEMAPQSWSQRISDAIDLDILSQVLASGTCDLSYLGRILDFALGTLQKLAAAASENEMIKTHKKLMDELGEISQGESIVIAMIKGLRFVLQETQKLKREISKARIRMLEPLIQGPAGFDYLRKAFDKSYGSPLNALNSLPVTVEWLSSVGSVVEQEWTKHRDSLSSLSTQVLPLTSLRTGGSISVSSTSTSPSPLSSSIPGCSEDEVDKIVRLGLLKLTSGIVGITAETIPETLKLNLSRLRNVQAEFQKIIVTCTSILILRQILASERLVNSASDMESLVSKCVDRVTELLARVEDVGIIDIVETMYVGIGEKSNEGQVKEVMGNMLGKSLRAGDPVFERVSRSVYEAARGIVFGGSGLQGRELAGKALASVGAALLTDKLIKVVEVVIVVATVSRNVHGSWYAEIMKSL